ncbi:MAG: radical SAM protein [Magnetococcales bacterium]|nr:radical SAM protein [Magnetococcales bacterium]
MTQNKILIFLGDLVHTGAGMGQWTFPLNVGYVGAYARKCFPDAVEVRLFKRPERLIEALKTERPAVVGLSHYVWNANLDRHVHGLVKRYHPQALTVGGGPNFTSLNADADHARAFFARHAACDAYVVNQGEVGFARLLERFLALGCDPERLRQEPVPGCLVNADGRGGAVHVAPPLEPLPDLDAIPSPYLTGLLDPFFAEAMTPILETNRSCPYRCTFCAWGIGTGKLTRFSDQRVFEEIDYVARRCRKSMNLFLADANFSILPRDEQIAARLHQAHEAHGFPGHCSIQWNKGNPERVVRVARALGGLSDITATLQSNDPKVLQAIQRTNLPLEKVEEVVAVLGQGRKRITVFSELILGLPEETRASHLAANRLLMDRGVEVVNFNLYLLPGTAMSSAETRQRYFRTVGWRIQDGAFGEYDGVRVIDGQEIVLATTTMGREELRGFRFIHALIQFMWSRKYFHDTLTLLGVHGVHPLDAILALADGFAADTGPLGRVMDWFRSDHDLENFPDFESLSDYWTGTAPFQRLRSGDYGKLNFQLTFKILLDHYPEFLALMQRVGESLLAAAGADPAAVDQVREVLRLSRALRIELTGEQALVDRKRLDMEYDFLAWRANGRRGAPEPVRTTCELFLPDAQRANLQRQLEQFRAANIHATLRKMSEYISSEDFFYKLRAA